MGRLAGATADGTKDFLEACLKLSEMTWEQYMQQINETPNESSSATDTTL